MVQIWKEKSLDKCEVTTKIVVGILSLGNKYAIDYYKTVLSSGGNAGYCIISSPKENSYSIYYIQAILNSKYIEWYCSLIGSIFRGGYISHGTQVLKKLPIPIIDFSNRKQKKTHDHIVILQKELIDTFDKIENENNERIKTPLQRKFNQKKQELDSVIKNLFQLGKDDLIIPIISEKYETN